MILITGHPRSGTGYMAELFQRFGMDVQHERMGEDGISCWAWATFDVDAPWCDGPRPGCETHLVHVVRHPLAVAQSVAMADKDVQSILYRKKYTIQVNGWSALDNAVLSVAGWCAIIKAQDPHLVVQVENAPAVLAKEYDIPMPHSLPSINTNTRPYGRISDECLLSNLRPETAELAEQLCAEYDYPLVGTEEPAHAE